MSPGSSSDLFEPSLAQAEPMAPPLSPRASFLISFFGGGLAAAMVGAWNAKRLRRPVSDLWIAGLAFCVAFGAFMFLLMLHTRGQMPGWIVALGGARRGPRTVVQILGFAIWGLFRWLQKDEQRAAALSGLETKNPWPVGLSMIGSSVLSYLLAGYLGHQLATDQ